MGVTIRVLLAAGVVIASLAVSPVRVAPALAATDVLAANPRLAAAAAIEAPTEEQKVTLVEQLTEPTQAGADAWRYARGHRSEFAAYRLNWNSDGCSHAPPAPLGFSFEEACFRHDFGYRNFKYLNRPEYKDRVDSMFHADMRRVCEARGALVGPVCDRVAWVYYSFVHVLGTIEPPARPSP